MHNKNGMTHKMKTYRPVVIEEKWRRIWEKANTYQTPVPQKHQDKFYCLDFFPYPSGAGLSVGHCKNYIPSDVVTRYQRMLGKAVMHPMGWDAFGLPAENEAIKVGIHPQVSTVNYATHYKRQLNLLGCSYDWEREINSSDPSYYRWNQFMFLMLYKRGLAYRQDAPVNWCSSCQTVLAAEEVEDGLCWRCHKPIIIRRQKQWFIRVTAYAEELYQSLEILDWPAHILNMQKAWIGRSEGVELTLYIPNVGDLSVFTTRVDTLFGVTFIALSPEHPLVETITIPKNRRQIQEYIQQSAQRTTRDRLTNEPDGVPTGRYIDTPWESSVPVYVADYVIASYGAGAVMGVPAHDKRDYLFATKMKIPIKTVIQPDDSDSAGLPFTEYGRLVNSGKYNGLTSQQAQEAISAWLCEHSIAKPKVYFRLRDWLISRQRYWGTPIPIIYCSDCGEVPVPEGELPIKLPGMPDYQPRGDGRSPLANASDFIITRCPRCGRIAQRETDTMTGFVCSSWYYLRFTDPHNEQHMVDPRKVTRWLPVDVYIGGAEHAVGHLLYSRFWTKFLADAGMIDFREPFPVLRSQGVMQIRNPVTNQIERMSKSKGNVVTPESVIDKYGADVLRLYILFMGPFEANTVWETNDEGDKPQHIDGIQRFTRRIWRLMQGKSAGNCPSADVETSLLQHLNTTIETVSEHINVMHFNVAISGLMTFVNNLEKHRRQYGNTPAYRRCCENLLKLLAPFAPFITEEIWQQIGGENSIHHAKWPEQIEITQEPSLVEIPIQINGKVRARLKVSAGIDDAVLTELVLSEEAVKSYTEGTHISKIIIIPQKVVNIVLV